MLLTREDRDGFGSRIEDQARLTARYTVAGVGQLMGDKELGCRELFWGLIVVAVWLVGPLGVVVESGIRRKWIETLGIPLCFCLFYAVQLLL